MLWFTSIDLKTIYFKTAWAFPRAKYNVKCYYIFTVIITSVLWI